MAGIFDPRCAQPVYLMDDDATARACGRLGGTIGGLFVGALVAVALFSLLHSHRRLSVGVSVASGVAACVVVVFLFSRISGFSMAKRHQAAQLNIEKMERSGMSRAQALAQEGQLYSMQQLARSGNGGGSFVGGALVGNMVANRGS